MAAKKKAQKPPNPPHRPSEYRPEFCEMVIAHMASGKSFASFGGIVSVSEQTLYNWRDAHADFLEAYRLGRAKSMNFWEEMGISGAVNSKGGNTLNTDCWKFNMKNRFGWRDKLDVEKETPQVNIYQSVMERIRAKKGNKNG